MLGMTIHYSFDIIVAQRDYVNTLKCNLIETS